MDGGWWVERERERGEKKVHGILPPPQLIDDIQTTVHNKRVHGPGLGTEPRGAIAACFRGTEFEFEQGRVAGVDDGEVVGHFPVFFFSLHSSFLTLCFSRYRYGEGVEERSLGDVGW